MNRNLKRVVAGVVALSGVTMITVEADALPMQNLAPSVTVGSSIEKAYIVCGRFRCWHRYGWRRPYWGWRRRYYRW